MNVISGTPTTFYAVRLAENTDTKAQNQYCDIGKDFDECMRKARLYTQTSYYQDISVIQLGVMEVWEVKS